MTKLINQLTSSLLFAFLLLAASPAKAQPPQSASSKVLVTTVVTVLSPNFTAPPPISKSDVIVYSGMQRLDVSALEPAQGDHSALQLAILIDDLSRIDTQLTDLRKFIQTLPNTTQVGVFYADNGAVRTAADFSTNHEAVAQKVRLTLGLGASPVSIYISMMDFMSRWPATDGRRAPVLVADVAALVLLAVAVLRRWLPIGRLKFLSGSGSTQEGGSRADVAGRRGGYRGRRAVGRDRGVRDRGDERAGHEG